MNWRRVLVVVALLSSCALVVGGCLFPPGPNAIDEHLVGPYKVHAQDYPEQSAVVYNCGGGLFLYRVDSVVIDVGWDDSYIVAIRRPPDQPGGELSYYYIDIAKDSGHGGGGGAVIGPLTQWEFETTKAILDLPEFTLHYPELR